MQYSLLLLSPRSLLLLLALFEVRSRGVLANRRLLLRAVSALSLDSGRLSGGMGRMEIPFHRHAEDTFARYALALWI
ncbi:hypothetical protein B0H16DRAFT_1531649 [Mycena metata]|uniref:Secreted protein n=1 Tax=Mycena metata TaxID=1033252 RepID=A0AAD7NHL1_9AGAR|nr:hypothetical protein B0H16DRAFT_1531649 [Mycena metata]